LQKFRVTSKARTIKFDIAYKLLDWKIGRWFLRYYYKNNAKKIDEYLFDFIRKEFQFKKKYHCKRGKFLVCLGRRGKPGWERALKVKDKKPKIKSSYREELALETKQFYIMKLKKV